MKVKVKKVRVDSAPGCGEHPAVNVYRSLSLTGEYSAQTTIPARSRKKDTAGMV